MDQPNAETILNEEDQSNIQKFFNKSNILITGGTGFLGKSK